MEKISGQHSLVLSFDIRTHNKFIALRRALVKLLKEKKLYNAIKSLYFQSYLNMCANDYFNLPKHIIQSLIEQTSFLIGSMISFAPIIVFDQKLIVWAIELPCDALQEAYALCLSSLAVFKKKNTGQNILAANFTANRLPAARNQHLTLFDCNFHVPFACLNKNLKIKAEYVWQAEIVRVNFAQIDDTGKVLKELL